VNLFNPLYYTPFIDLVADLPGLVIWTVILLVASLSGRVPRPALLCLAIAAVLGLATSITGAAGQACVEIAIDLGWITREQSGLASAGRGAFAWILELLRWVAIMAAVFGWRDPAPTSEDPLW
jgi:hypothetical protein